MPRLVAISDTHNNYPALPEGDILVHCGDLTAQGSLEELSRAAAWLGAQPHQYKYVVPGNHDREFREGLFQAVGVTPLIDREETILGLRIWGSPWTPKFQQWGWMKSEEELEEPFSLIPKGLDVLITHGPPKGILDQNYDYSHTGSTTLKRHVLRAQPRVHLFGHIHEDGGKSEKHPLSFDTTFYNVAWVGVDRREFPLPDGTKVWRPAARVPNPPLVLEL